MGGDHLGPNPWTVLAADAAMAKAEVMVAAYVAAGFRKIHLDCSMSCAGDPTPLPEAEIVKRAVRLAGAAERAHAQAGGEPPVYVIGTEVPVPGGATEAIEGLAVTTPQAALATIEAHRQAFVAAGLTDAWNRVIASVVQPGVEFDHHNVIDYGSRDAQALSHAITAVPNMVYEAHSTDYQTRGALRALVKDHFAILKVGPGLTFAMREALWALDAMDQELTPEHEQARLRDTVLERMRKQPKYWERYYHGSRQAAHRGSAVLTERPRAVLLAGPRDRKGAREAVRKPERGPAADLTDQPASSRGAARRARGSGDARSLVPCRGARQRRPRRLPSCLPHPLKNSNHLGIPADELAASGALWTAREIEQQPQMLQRTHTLSSGLHAELQKFVAPVCEQPARARHSHRARAPRRTSASAWRRCWMASSPRAWMRLPTTDIVSNPRLHLNAEQPLLLVSFGRSGNSPESIQAVTLAESLVKDVRHLSSPATAKAH